MFIQDALSKEAHLAPFVIARQKPIYFPRSYSILLKLILVNAFVDSAGLFSSVLVVFMFLTLHFIMLY